jgi:hypothetical protein
MYSCTTVRCSLDKHHSIYYGRTFTAAPIMAFSFIFRKSEVQIFVLLPAVLIEVSSLVSLKHFGKMP